MRRSSSGFGIISKGKRFQGVAFGTDFCAEHEFGTKEINKALGWESPPAKTVEDRIIKHTDNLQFFTFNYRGKNFHVITLSDKKIDELCWDLKHAPSALMGEGWFEKPSEIKVAWGGYGGFQIIFHPDKTKEAEKLWKELHNNNVSFIHTMSLRRAGMELKDFTGPALVIVNKLGKLNKEAEK